MALTLTPDQYMTLTASRRANILVERLRGLEEAHYKATLDMEDAGACNQPQAAEQAAAFLANLETQIAAVHRGLHGMPESSIVLEAQQDV